MFEEIIKYWHVVAFLIPLGVVGVWRWSVWLIKKSLSLIYVSPKGNFVSTLSIVVPVYNEDPEVFKRALESWRRNDPNEIIAVIDYSNEDLIDIFQRFSDVFAGAKLIVTPKPGKRAALADGIAASRGEIVALVDSDTVWSENIKKKILAPFSDSEIGGLTVRQDVFKADTVARKLFKILLDDRYLTEYPFLTTVSDALLCLSGRTAVYRRSAIAGKLDRLVNEKFLGKPMISGDDKTLTNIIHEAGWKSVFLRDVKVYTPGVASLGNFLKQKVRWARNGVRSDMRVLASGWVWRRHKILALYMIDKTIAAITILLSPIYFMVAIYAGYWQIAVIIAAWWIMSRAVKIFPHLKERPFDVFFLPEYIIMTFVMAGAKIYAFFSMDKQGWITRWDKSRLGQWNFYRQSMAYALTFLFFAAYVSIVGSYQYSSLTAPVPELVAKASPANIISDQPRMLSDSDLNAKIKSILDYKKDNSSGYYIVRKGDTLLGLQRRYYLPSIDAIKKENGGAISEPDSISIGTKIMIPASELRNIPTSEQVLSSPAARFVPSLITYDKTSNTITVTGTGSVVTLTEIKQSLGNSSDVLQQTSPREWILRANLDIRKDVTLVIDDKDTKQLKLRSGKDNFIWIRSQNGNILISDTKITSWDESLNSPDVNTEDGRSFIVAKGNGRMDVSSSEIAYLGHVGLEKRGGEFGGSYGLSWKNTSGRLNNDLLTGSAVGNNIHDNYFGLYTFGVTGVVFKGNDVHNNVQYGIDPHDDSNNMLITENKAYDNGNHGIILSKRCVNNEITNNVSYGNRLHGIMLDRQSNNNIVTGNLTYGNVDGVVLFDSGYNLISENEFRDNKQGVRLNSASSFNYFEKNKIISNSTAVHVYQGSTGNVFVDNEVKGNNLALSIQDAEKNVFYANFRSQENIKDGNIKTAPESNEIKF